MSDQRKDQFFFVGRQAELARFDAFLRDPRGQAAVVVGQQGMGKTMLLERLIQRCAELSSDQFHVNPIRFVASDEQDAASVMEQILDVAFQVGGVTERSLDQTDRRREQWRAFLNVINIGDLVMSLPRNVRRPTRDELIDRLKQVSSRMPENARAVFLIDPEKYLKGGSPHEWRLLVAALPDRMKFVFSQRPEDVLIRSHDFIRLPNVIRIPPADLDALDAQSCGDLIQVFAQDILLSSGAGTNAIAAAIGNFDGHPYATRAALDLMVAGTPPDRIPSDPSGIATAQWDLIREIGGPEAVRLFEGLAILEVPVPCEIIETVAGVDSPVRKALEGKTYLAGLLRREDERVRIYHSLLRDHITAQISPTHATIYHRRAIDVYRKRLNANFTPDALAAGRLPWHVLKVEGLVAFVHSLVNECTGILLQFGLFDELSALSNEAVAKVPSKSREAAALHGNLGLIHESRGDLAAAESNQLLALAISEEVGPPEALGWAWSNLGSIYQMRGELQKAEEMYARFLRTAETMNRIEDIAAASGSLGNIFRKCGRTSDAIVMCKRAYEIDKGLGLQSALAADALNLGACYQEIDCISEARMLYEQCYSIAQATDDRFLMARSLGALGTVNKSEGKLVESTCAMEESLRRFRELRDQEGVASQLGNLGILYRIQGDADRSEALFKEAMRVSEEIGWKEGIAIAHNNLAGISSDRGDKAQARVNWTKSRDLYVKCGMPHMAEKVQGWLDKLDA